jgi:hypothetical protein
MTLRSGNRATSPQEPARDHRGSRVQESTHDHHEGHRRGDVAGVRQSAAPTQAHWCRERPALSVLACGESGCGATSRRLRRCLQSGHRQPLALLHRQRADPIVCVAPRTGGTPRARVRCASGPPGAPGGRVSWRLVSYATDADGPCRRVPRQRQDLCRRRHSTAKAGGARGGWCAATHPRLRLEGRMRRR